jgi:hypothetical protein
MFVGVQWQRIPGSSEPSKLRDNTPSRELESSVWNVAQISAQTSYMHLANHDHVPSEPLYIAVGPDGKPAWVYSGPSQTSAVE